MKGFKNLLDADIWFGAFTCIAGANGVGKSNLFDAITFLRLLASEPLLDIAADTFAKVDVSDNPLRQVIINTHSPSVVNQVTEESLVIAVKSDGLGDSHPYASLSFAALPGTWRTSKPKAGGLPLMEECPLGRLLSYLNPVPNGPTGGAGSKTSGLKRVIDRKDLRQLLLFGQAAQ